MNTLSVQALSLIASLASAYDYTDAINIGGDGTGRGAAQAYHFAGSVEENMVF